MREMLLLLLRIVYYYQSAPSPDFIWLENRGENEIAMFSISLVNPNWRLLSKFRFRFLPEFYCPFFAFLASIELVKHFVFKEENEAHFFIIRHSVVIFRVLVILRYKSVLAGDKKQQQLKNKWRRITISVLFRRRFWLIVLRYQGCFSSELIMDTKSHRMLSIICDRMAYWLL